MSPRVRAQCAPTPRCNDTSSRQGPPCSKSTFRSISTLMSASARSAASVLLGVRAAAAHGADYRLLLMRRSARSSFMPRTCTFPGGALAAEDRAHDDRATLRMCAARELFEETGLLLGANVSLRAVACIPGVDGDARAERAKVSADAGRFRQLLLSLAPGSGEPPALLGWARFLAPRFEKRAFDAHFFVGAMDGVTTQADAEAASESAGLRVARRLDALHDLDADDATSAEEASILFWASPREALDLAEAGTIVLPPPQFILLRSLADDFDQLDAVVAEARHREADGRAATIIQPELVTCEQSAAARPEEVAMLVMPGDTRHSSSVSSTGHRNRVYLAPLSDAARAVILAMAAGKAPPQSLPLGSFRMRLETTSALGP